MNLPYLLLDIREKEEYDTCHIISALSYPIAMLSRSVNNETKEMLSYKNQPGIQQYIFMHLNKRNEISVEKVS